MQNDLAHVETFVRTLFDGRHLPSAAELLGRLDTEIGPRGRHYLYEAMTRLSKDVCLGHADRNYLLSSIENGELNQLLARPSGGKDAASTRALLPVSSKNDGTAADDRSGNAHAHESSPQPTQSRPWINVVLGCVGAAIVAGAVYWIIFHRDDGQRERDERRATEARAEDVLMADTLRAGSELERRIRTRIAYRDGVLIVSDDFDMDLYALPATTPWRVDCRMWGLTITFGAGTSAEQDNSGFTLDLTRANLARDQCKSLAPIVAQKVLAIAKGN